MRQKIILFCVLIAFTARVAAFAEDEIEKVKKLFEKTAAKVKSIECLAESVTYQYKKNIGVKKIKIFAKQPDKLRIDYLEPKAWAGSFILFDGQTIYHYTNKIKKAIKINLKKVKSGEHNDKVTSSKSLDMQLSSLTNLVAKDAKSFFEKNDLKILGKEKAGGKECYKLQIAPKQKSTMKMQQTIWMDVKTGLTWKIDFVLEFLDREEVIEIKELKINVEISDDTFVYTGDTL